MHGAVARHFVAGGSLALVLAQPGLAQGIYTCTDGQGHKITADRPIPACADRPQRELNPSGTLRRQIGPTLTAEERARQEEHERAAADERTRIAEIRRRDRALVVRYPTAQAHDKERATAIAQIDELIATAHKRITELAQQRVRADTEMEFYSANPARAPETLKRQISDIDGNTAAQQRFIAEQEAEKKRVHARFDEEQARLRALWTFPPE